MAMAGLRREGRRFAAPLLSRNPTLRSSLASSEDLAVHGFPNISTQIVRSRMKMVAASQAIQTRASRGMALLGDMPTKFQASRCMSSKIFVEDMQLLEEIEPKSLFEMVKGEEGRFLGLNIDSSTVGVALSDVGNRVSSVIDDPVDLPNIVLLRSGDMIPQLHDMVLKHFVKGFVIGRSVDQFGEFKNDTANKDAESFIKDLNDSGKFKGLHYCYQKDNFTLEIAEFLVETSSFDENTKKMVGSNIAASQMLQGFLNEHNLGVR